MADMRWEADVSWVAIPASVDRAGGCACDGIAAHQCYASVESGNISTFGPQLSIFQFTQTLGHSLDEMIRL